jgi:hypothetical protein
MTTKWYQSKTDWTVIGGAIATVVATITGFELPSWFAEAVGGLALIFLRQGVTKSGPTQ